MPLLVCPNCNVGMTQVQRSGVELDVCPQCRGVWLDRGELEKLLQPLREAEATPTFLPPGASPWSPPAPQPPNYSHQDSHHHERHGGYGHDGHHEKHDSHDYGHAHHYQKQKGWRSILDVFD